MGEAYYWIGVTVTVVVGIVGIAIALIWLYANLLHQRFQVILFRQGARRLSLASWHQARSIRKGEEGRSDDWPADDYPICKHPFFLSYRFNGRNYFIMLGWLGNWRNSVIKGDHP